MLLKKIIKRISLFKCWGSFRRLKPFSYMFGYDRGSQSVVRYYIDSFIAGNASYIKGKVLEIGDNTYTMKNGTDVIKSDVLHIQDGFPNTTIVGDLTRAENIPSNEYDCLIITQTLQCIYDYKAALKNIYRILKPGGVVLVTSSGISHLSTYDMERWGDYWRFTSLSAKMDFEQLFPAENVEVKTYGNVLTAISFLEGLASRELRKKELDFQDPHYELVISIKATKPL